MKIKVAVVEDDDRYAKHLRGFIDRYASETGVEIEAVRYSDAERFLSEYRPGYSVIYMDIELGGMNGINASARLRETDEIVSLCYGFAEAFEKEFSSLRCRELRPGGFSESDPPHLCENLTVEAIIFSYGYLRLQFS